MLASQLSTILDRGRTNRQAIHGHRATCCLAPPHFRGSETVAITSVYWCDTDAVRDWRSQIYATAARTSLGLDR